MTERKHKLELTWIGKDKQPQPEPRILIEDAGKSYGDRKSNSACLRAQLSGNTAISSNNWYFLRYIAEIRLFHGKMLAVMDWISYTSINTRAVPLARKGDAHQGRVFYFSIASKCEEYAL